MVRHAQLMVLCLLFGAPVLAQAEVDLFEHEDEVLDAAFSDDGAWMATVSMKGIHVYDARSWEPTQIVPFKSHSIGISNDGKRLAVANLRPEVYVLKDDMLARTWPTGTEAVASPTVQLTRHGLFFGSTNGAVTRLDPVKGAVLWTKTGHEGNVWIHTTLNGRFLATCGGQRGILWDAQKGAELQRFEHADEDCSSIAVSEDGAVLVTGGRSKVHVWDVKAGNVRETILTTGESLALSRDGRRLALGTPKAFTLWDVPTMTTLAVIPGSARVFSFSPDGRRIVTSRRDKANVLRIYDVDALTAAPWNQTVTALRGVKPSRPSSIPGIGRFEPAGLRGQVGHEQGVLAVKVSADGKTLWSTAKPSSDGTFITKVWDVAGRRVIRHHPGVVMDVAARGDLAMVGDRSATILLDKAGAEVGKVEDGELLTSTGQVIGLSGGALTVRGRDGRRRTGPPLPDPPQSLLQRLMGDAAQYRRLAASDDGKVIAAASDLIGVVVDGGTLKARRELVGHTKPISEIAVARNGKVIVTMSEQEGKAMAWDAARGTLLAEHPFTGKVRTSAVDGSGTLAALGFESGDVVVWETRTGRNQLVVKPIATMDRGFAPVVTSLDFAADGTLFIGSLDGSIRIWNTKAKKPVARLTGFVAHGQLVDETLEPPAPPFTATSGRLHRDLVDACADGKDDVAVGLLGRLGPVNLEFEVRGWTVLAVCAGYNNPKATRLLLERGANPDFHLKQRETPLMQATVRDHVEVVRALLAGGADVAARRADKATALHLALCRDTPAPRALIAALLDATADPNAEGPTKQTPLHCAARTSAADVVTLLLERGARVDAKDADGFTPLAHAEDLGRRDVVAVLQRAPSPPPPATSSSESPPPAPAPPTCPAGASWNGSVCVATEVSCPAGTSWNGSACMTASVACPSGTTWNGQSCASSNVSCPEGTQWNGTNCVRPPSCPVGEAWDGQKCSRPAGTSPDRLRPGQARTDDKGFVWVWIPPVPEGFKLRTPPGRYYSDFDNFIDGNRQGFWMMQTEVTANAWARCVGAGACRMVTCEWGKPGEGLEPAVCMDFQGAKAFCQWAGGRLPMPWEWEFAARSGADVDYPWGNTPPTATQANCKTCGDPFERLAPVGSFPEGDTAWGLKDMAGNVWEWTGTERYSSTGDRWAVKGGSFYDPPRELHTSQYMRVLNTKRDHNIGLRCVQDAAP